MTNAIIALCILAMVAWMPVAGAAQDRAVLIEEGRVAFKRVGCYNCHTVGSVGTGLAPDLSHVGAKYNSGYLERWLRDPREVRPSGHMPALELTDDDIRALAAFLAAQR
jgi:cytochrome c553